MQSAATISTTFIWRRVHSLLGLWIVFYLILHLVTNSQAALWMGNNGFIRMVNSLENLPYLHVIEIVLIGIPLAVHAVWGVRRALTARMNVHSTRGPALKYERNRAYSWQRLTSWILLFGIIGHVVQMRFLEMPKKVALDDKELSIVKVSQDPGLYPLAERLEITLYQRSEYPTDFPSFSLRSNQVIAVADSPGKAMLLMIRDTFKSPWMAAFYTIFVLSAVYHACNGLWTFLITWGIILSYRAQKSMIPVCLIGAIVLAFLGLAAIWGSYWI